MPAAPRQRKHDFGECDAQPQADKLHADERPDAAIDVRHGDRRRHGALQVEQREAIGRCQEAGLQVHGAQHGEPRQHLGRRLQMVAKIQRLHHRIEYRQHDQRDLGPFERNAKHKDQRHQHQQDAPAIQAQALEQPDDQVVAAGDAEDVAEHRGADEDHEDHGVGQRRLLQHLADDGQGEPPLHRGQRGRTDTAHAGGLGWGGPAGIDRSQHEHDQRQHRDEPTRDQPQIGTRACRHVGQPGAGCQVGPDRAGDDNEAKIQHRKHQARHQCGSEQRPDRNAHDLGHHHQHDAGPESARQGIRPRRSRRSKAAWNSGLPAWSAARSATAPRSRRRRCRWSPP